MTKVRGPRALTLLALLASFGAGVFVDGWLRTYGPPMPAGAAAKPSEAPADSTVVVAPPPVDRPSGRAAEPKMAPAADSGAPSATGLRVPIDGISIESFSGGFSELRGSHPHEAVDIVVPRGTPVHAVQDGTIAKLFFSAAGGTTIYQFDPDERLCYYYAHLERYADFLHEGQHVSQGEVIGYVGTSGNAPPDTPHLHFAIFELNADRKWWQGRPLDPYLVFREKGGDSTTQATAADLAFCVEETNRYRARAGKALLTQSATLESYAATGAHVDATAAVAHFHFASTNGGGVAMAENEVRAAAMDIFGTIQEAMRQSIARFYAEGPSGGHHQNLEGPYTQVGCGVFIGNGVITFVQDFR